jgi:hypothetical protein
MCLSADVAINASTRQAQQRVRMSKNLSTSLLCVFLFLKSENDEGVIALADFFRCCLAVTATGNITLHVTTQINDIVCLFLVANVSCLTEELLHKCFYSRKITIISLCQ